jgi:hypothetical protein
VKRLNLNHFWLAALPLSILTALPVAAQDAPKETPKETTEKVEFPQGILFPYSLLDYTLAGNVDKDGHVNYVGMQKNIKGLDLFLQAVAGADLSAFPVLPRKVVTKDKLGREEEKTVEDRSAELVFWINAHNAHVLKAILTAYPIGTPDGIENFYTAKTRRVAGKDYSLEEIRKKAIALDPRAFFALSDGTVGGPLLRQSAYRLVGLNEALNYAAQWFISNPNNVSLLVIQKKSIVNPVLQDADELFRPKGARQKWAGIRQLLMDYSVVGSSQRFYINNPDAEIEFGRPLRSLNRDPNQGPITGG